MSPLLIDAALSAAHFLALLVMVGAIAAEGFVMRLAPSASVLRLLARIDIFYGASAGVLLAAGAGRVFFGLKDASFYLHSHAFWGKIAVFLIIGLISIWPTVKFLNWGTALRKDGSFLPPEAEWKTVRRIVTSESHLLVLVVIFAVLMARGIG